MAAVLVGASTVGGIVLFFVAGIMPATTATVCCAKYTFGISTRPRVHRLGHHLCRHA